MKGGQYFQQRHGAHKCLNLFLLCKENLCFGVEIHIWSRKHVADVEKKKNPLLYQKWSSVQSHFQTGKGKISLGKILTAPSEQLGLPQLIIYFIKSPTC